MNRVLSSLTSNAYHGVVKPILFKQSPDTVHRRMLYVGSHVQRLGLARRLVHAAWSYRNPQMLRQTVHGITFENPVGLSAGFDKNFRLVPLMKSVGFGFMEGGSVTLQRCEGNPRPWFYRLPKTKSIVVHVGLANDGIAAVTRRLRDYPSEVRRHFPINVSVAKTNSPEACSELRAIDDYIGSLRIVKKARVADMVTLNISCPNTYGGEPFTGPRKLNRLLGRVDALKLDVPVFVKMPVDLPWSESKKLLDVMVQHDVAGVTVGNLTKNRAKVALKDPLPDHVRGGLSGKPTWDVSNDLIRRTYVQYGDRLTIIGVGGIFSAEDAYTKIRLGAQLVELITGMIYEGPQLIGQINRGLAELLARDGFVNVGEAVGVDAHKSSE